MELDALNLHGVQEFDRLADAIKGYATARPDDSLVFATAADYDIIGPGQGADRHLLDRIIPDRPFAMIAADHHTIWANTAALETAGILHGGAVPEGCEIVIGNDGNATGMLVEPGAYGLIIALAPTGGREFAGLVTGHDPVPAANASERAVDRKIIQRVTGQTKTLYPPDFLLAKLTPIVFIPGVRSHVLSNTPEALARAVA